MSLPISARKKTALVACLASLAVPLQAQEGFGRVGGEYAIAGAIPGDQTRAQVAVGANGGYVVWQDNFTDGAGLGIGARKLDGSLSATLSSFRVNEQADGDQENAQVALTKDGGAIFVWQGGVNGASGIFARILSAKGTFVTGDIRVNTFSNGQQTRPAVATLNDGSVVIIWSSRDQDGSMEGVYGQRLSAAGSKLGAEFRVNVSSQLNQRNPSVSSLSGGGFVVVWVSEKEKGATFTAGPNGVGAETASGAVLHDVGIYASIYGATGQVVKPEFRLDKGGKLCGTPVVSAGGNGGFTVAWGVLATLPAQAGVNVSPESWDVYVGAFNQSGESTGLAARVNTYTYGDQVFPQIATLGSRQLVVWTSMGQDGSFEGVYGRLLNTADASVAGPEQQINTVTRGPQVYPSVAADGGNRFVTVWSGFVGAVEGYDLFAQRHGVEDLLTVPDHPYVSALSQSKLSVTWPELAGYSGVRYDLYIDSAATPVVVEGNSYVAGQLLAGSTHSFRIAYRLADGRSSTPSEPVTGTTWGEDESFDGLPDSWQAKYWGANRSNWPGANVDSDGDGATNIQEFLAGTNPVDTSSVLRIELVGSPQGPRLQWNTEPGSLYQVQITSDLVSWTNLTGLRFAAGVNDSIAATGESSLGYYRVLRQR